MPNAGNNTVAIINVASDTVIGTVSDGSESINAPYAVAFTPDGSQAYVTNQAANSVSIIDANSSSGRFNEVIGIVTDLNSATLIAPSSITFTPDGTKAYVCNTSATATYSVSIIDVATASVITSIDGTGDYYNNNPVAVAFTPDSSTAYICNANNNSQAISIVDVATNTITGTIDLARPNQRCCFWIGILDFGQ